MFVHLITRATSRIAGGDTLRRNEEWMTTAGSYSANVGLTILLLRPFPNFLRPFVAQFLSPVRQMKRQVGCVKKLFAPMVEQRRAAEALNDPNYKKPDDFLQWMMDGVEDEEDFDPEILSHHMLVLTSMAVIHTSSITLTQALYDLIARPEYLEPLREEIQVTFQNGWENATKASLDAQWRLDSFMRESQRFSSIGDCKKNTF
jgi:cytochrome P450